MSTKIYPISVISICLILICAVSGLAQEPLAPEATAQNPAAEPEIQWLWGEVVSVDAANKAVTIKYLDYETDQEKEAVVTVDEKTTYENIKSLDEIQPQQTLSIDYIVNAEGKSIARNISLEKPEEAPATEPVIQPGLPANELPQP